MQTFGRLSVVEILVALNFNTALRRVLKQLLFHVISLYVDRKKLILLLHFQVI